MDLIDRAEVIKLIHRTVYEFMDVDNDGQPITTEDKILLSVNKAICNEIKDLPSAEKTDWIPCSEQMPEVCDRVLVTVLVDGERYVDTAIAGGTYIDDFFDTHIDWDEGNSPHIIAWMPLPKPYKE